MNRSYGWTHKKMDLFFFSMHVHRSPIALWTKTRKKKKSLFRCCFHTCKPKRMRTQTRYFFSICFSVILCKQSPVCRQNANRLVFFHAHANRRWTLWLETGVVLLVQAREGRGSFIYASINIIKNLITYVCTNIRKRYLFIGKVTSYREES